MSNRTRVFVICDKCGVQGNDIDDTSIRKARAGVKADGWKLGKKRDFCAECAAEIATAVKLAQSGVNP